MKVGAANSNRNESSVLGSRGAGIAVLPMYNPRF